jgi:hypothetical protein
MDTEFTSQSPQAAINTVTIWTECEWKVGQNSSRLSCLMQH